MPDHEYSTLLQLLLCLNDEQEASTAAACIDRRDGTLREAKGTRGGVLRQGVPHAASAAAKARVRQDYQDQEHPAKGEGGLSNRGVRCTTTNGRRLRTDVHVLLNLVRTALQHFGWHNLLGFS